MLLPALARAREQARRGVCISNLKQIGLGIHMYAQDFDENFPMYDFNGGGQISECGAGQSLSLLIPKYVKDTGVFVCPSSADTKAPWWIDLERGVIGGTPPSGATATANYLPLYWSTSATDAPSSTLSYAYAPGLHEQSKDESVVCADKLLQFGTAGVAPYYGWWTTTPYVQTSDIHGSDGINVLYVSGNVSWVASYKSGSYLWLPREKLGSDQLTSNASEAIIRNPGGMTGALVSY
ncbi:MAG: DUF1559 domain-containing protein [Candidatus Omnitrophica bacterium]|nr:DUF1559 domain-containing protein [Candidatus Omnitrophota bacterium]